MGSIEGVIILSSTNEPILHSNFLHPLPNYPILHVDQLATKLEATAPLKKDILPILFTDGIPHIAEEHDKDEDSGEETLSETDEDQDRKRPATGSALVQIQHNGLCLVATFSKHGAS